LEEADDESDIESRVRLAAFSSCLALDLLVSVPIDHVDSETEELIENCFEQMPFPAEFGLSDRMLRNCIAVMRKPILFRGMLKSIVLAVFGMTLRPRGFLTRHGVSEATAKEVLDALQTVLKWSSDVREELESVARETEVGMLHFLSIMEDVTV
jgi:hypothetical protein